jgi:hypothetical protein
MHESQHVSEKITSTGYKMMKTCYYLPRGDQPSWWMRKPLLLLVEPLKISWSRGRKGKREKVEKCELPVLRKVYKKFRRVSATTILGHVQGCRLLKVKFMTHSTYKHHYFTSSMRALLSLAIIFLILMLNMLRKHASCRA